MSYRGWTLKAYGQYHPHYPPFVATARKGSAMFNVEGNTVDDSLAKARAEVDRREA